MQKGRNRGEFPQECRTLGFQPAAAAEPLSRSPDTGPVGHRDAGAALVRGAMRAGWVAGDYGCGVSPPFRVNDGLGG